MTMWDFASAHPFWFTVNVFVVSTLFSVAFATILSNRKPKNEHHHYNGDIHVSDEEEN